MERIAVSMRSIAVNMRSASGVKLGKVTRICSKMPISSSAGIAVFRYFRFDLFHASQLKFTLHDNRRIWTRIVGISTVRLQAHFCCSPNRSSWSDDGINNEIVDADTKVTIWGGGDRPPLNASLQYVMTKARSRTRVG